MAEEHKVTLKAVLDTTDIKQQLASLQGQTSSSLGNAVSSLEKSTKDAAKAQNEAANAAKSAALGFKDAKGIIKAVAGGFAAKVIGNTIGGTAGATVSGIGQGAAAGAAFGPVGMAIGAAVGGVSEAISQMAESIQKKKDELAKAFEDAATALTRTSERLQSVYKWRQDREYKQFAETATQRELEDHLTQTRNRRQMLENRMGTASELANKQQWVDLVASMKDKTRQGSSGLVWHTPVNVMQQEYDEAKKYLEEQEKIKAEIIELDRQEALLQSEIEKREAEKTKEQEEQNKINAQMIEDAKRKAIIYKEVAEETAKAEEKTKQIEKQRLSELDNQMQKYLTNTPDYLQNIGDMTSVQKYGFGMGEVEDSAISLAQMQLDMQTQIRNSVEQIKNNITGNSTQVAVAG